MKPHPYLRAYMAGALTPTIVLMFIACGYALIRFGLHLPIAIEKGIVFPVAFVPNLWGAWNVFYVALHRKHAWPLGAHGALLPFVLVPLGLLVGTTFGLIELRQNVLVYVQGLFIPYHAIFIAFCCALILYYFVWKYLVGYLNRVVEIA